MILSSSSGMAGLITEGGAGVSFRSEAKIIAAVAPPNARRPVAISYSTKPKEKRSVRVSSFSPRVCSGDI